MIKEGSPFQVGCTWALVDQSLESFSEEVTVLEKARFCVITALEVCFLLCFDCATWHKESEFPDQD